MTGTLVFYSEFDDFDQWKRLLQREIPSLDVQHANAVTAPEKVHYALVWKPPENFFQHWPNLELVINLGAGVDALVDRPDLSDIPVTRLSDPNMARMMAGYVLFAVLRYARDIPFFEQMQKQARWQYRHPRAAEEIRVGVMGLGELGGKTAQELARQGFSVAGWSRTAKEIESVEGHHGMASLESFLSRTDILVIMLPSTPDTRGLMNDQHLAMLPHGASLINVSRGDIVDEPALIAHLSSGQIGAATLDVFAHEPLPDSHPFWAMENVLITPHLASVALPSSAVKQVAANIHRVRDKQPPLHCVDLNRGY